MNSPRAILAYLLYLTVGGVCVWNFGFRRVATGKVTFIEVVRGLWQLQRWPFDLGLHLYRILRSFEDK
jgi:hypothetical protein